MAQTCRPGCLIFPDAARNSIFLVAQIDDIIREHRPAVFAFTRSQVRDAAIVDDIVQETFIRVWRYLPSYRGEGSLQGWIIRICQNVIRTTMKKSARIAANTDEGADVSALSTSSNCDDYDNVDLLDLISTLSADHRAVTTMCLVLGYTYEETAEILDVPVGTVRSRVSRAREQLRARLADGVEAVQVPASAVGQ